MATQQHTMDIRFQPALLQEVIDSFIEKTEREGDPTYYKEFHELADPIYEKYSLDDRETGIQKAVSVSLRHLGILRYHSQCLRRVSCAKRKSRDRLDQGRAEGRSGRRGCAKKVGIRRAGSGPAV